jgi:uncharacterized membrane protein
LFTFAGKQGQQGKIIFTLSNLLNCGIMHLDMKTRTQSHFPYLTWFLLLVLLCLPGNLLAQGGEVRAILFFSPTCGHCHKVITEDLPPLFEQYPDRLNIIGVDISAPEGQQLYQAAIERLEIPDDRRGVPTLIIDDVVLVGSGEIPEQLPGLVEQYMAEGGVDWPDIPGIEAILSAEGEPAPAETGKAQGTATADATETPAPEEETPATAATEAKAPEEPTATPDATEAAPATPDATQEAVAAGATTEPPASSPASASGSSGLTLPETQPPDLRTRLMRDPAGNGVAVLVLIGLIGMVVYTAVAFRQPIDHAKDPPSWSNLAIPILSLIGIVVAAYLAYVETAEVSAVCGPVGDCNTVQQSSYARLFGVLPIGWLGVIGYVAIIAAWLVKRSATGQLAHLAALALFAMTLFGTLFSIYLTFLEPFVIGATCMWCITSAIVMALLLWLSIPDGRRAIKTIAHPQ